MRGLLLTAALAGVAGVAAAQDLRAPADFADIRDKTTRSAQMFVEAGKVIQHPRCLNCHPAGDRPTQGDDGHPHQPPVIRGAADFGAPGMECATCHTSHNTPLATESIRSMPGSPAWKLAPLNMAWQGRTLGDICRQIKDPARNGGRDLEKIRHHMADDDLVGWGWAPGAGRTPAPGSQKQFGDLIRAWIETGAACPG